MKQDRRLWMMVAALSAVVVCWGIWIMFRPHTAAQADSLQGILMEHVKYLPEVYQVHENYVQKLHNDTCAVLIYRYSPNTCNRCYLDDLSFLKEFQKNISKNITLVLPAYSVNDRNIRIRMIYEMDGFRYRNIPADSLSLPISDEGEKRYFAVVDTLGQVGMVFFPVKGRQDLTQRYFQEIAGFFPSQTIAKKDSVAVAP